MALSQLISNLGHEEGKELHSFIIQISNDLTSNVLRKLVTDGPIDVKDLPSKELGEYSKLATLSKLHQLESMNIVRSEMKKSGKRYYRVFSLRQN